MNNRKYKYKGFSLEFFIEYTKYFGDDKDFPVPSNKTNCSVYGTRRNRFCFKIRLG